MGLGDSKIEHICLLSTHGYVDPIPQLGRTDTGGQVVYVLQLAKALTTHKLKADIYTRWFDPSKRQIDPIPGCPNVRIIRIPAGSWKFIPKEEIYDILPELTENMIRFIREKNLHYDIYHGHYVDAGIVTLDVAKAFDKPAFFTAHSLGAWKREQMVGNSKELEIRYNFSHRISEELRIFRSVKAQTVTTKVQEKKLEQLYGVKSDNVIVVPPGVDVHNFRPANPTDKKVKTDLPDRYIFCLSRIDANKGHDFLLKAFDRVRKVIPDIHLVIGGGSQKPQPRELKILSMMKKIIDENNMHPNAHIVGYVSDELLVPFYQQAALFVLPSLFEPFGMTVLEAMACKKPVIASKLGGIKDTIVSEKNGLLIDPSDKIEFANAMIRLLKDQQLAKRLGNAGYKTIQSFYSWEAIAGRHIEFYKQFI